MRHERSVAAAVMMWTSLAVGCDSTYVMTEQYELLEDGGRKPAGAGCVLAFEGGRGGGGGSSGGFSGSNDLIVTERAGNDAFSVVVTSEGDELARRKYSEDWALSRKRDEFMVTTQAGRTFTFAYWGGPECDKPEQEAE